MPFFTLQIVPQGPLVLAFIGVSFARRDALVAGNQPVPPAVRINGLIDTGASGTCVDPSVLQQLSVPPTGQVMVDTASTGSQPHLTDQYDVSILIPGDIPTAPPFIEQNVPVIASELLQRQGIHALIGRDILSKCLFAYNGKSRTFSLAY